MFGSRDYSMRVWLDPDRLQSLGMTANDVTQALQAQNIQVASGVLNQPPVDKPGAFQIAVQTLGRLADPEEFANIVVKQTPNAVVRLQGRRAASSLPAQDYSSNSYLNLDPAVAIAIFQTAGLERARHRQGHPQDDGRAASKRFPPGIKYAIVYDPTQFIQQSVDAVHGDDPRGDPAGRAGRRAVPADLARRHHSAGRHSGVADRHVLLHGDCSASR